MRKPITLAALAVITAASLYGCASTDTDDDGITNPSGVMLPSADTSVPSSTMMPSATSSTSG